MGIAGSLILIGLFVILQKKNESATVTLPELIAGQPLKIADSGGLAIKEISGLLEQPATLRFAKVGIYAGEYNIRLWIAGYSWRAFAGRMMSAFNEKIAASGLPFQPPEETSWQGRKVYRFEGLGQTHYYFQSGALTLWLSADPEVAETALKEVMEQFPR